MARRRRAGVGAALYVVRVASILVAYKAKMLCSEVLLADRDPRVATTELEVDDLTPFRYVYGRLMRRRGP